MVFYAGIRIDQPRAWCLRQAGELGACQQNWGNESKKAIGIRWEPPPLGWVKHNSDGSVMGWPGQVGAGGVIRGNGGEWLRGFTRHMGMAKSMLEKIWAVRDGLIMAKDMGFDSVIVELDSKAIFDKISSCDDKNLPLNPLIAECRISSCDDNLSLFVTRHDFVMCVYHLFC